MYGLRLRLSKQQLLALAILALPCWPCAEAAPAFVETPFFRFVISPENGGFEINDNLGGVTWQSSPFQARFGEIRYVLSGKSERADLTGCQVTPSAAGLELTFRPVGSRPELWFRTSIRAGDDQTSLEVSYESASGLAIESARLLDDAFWVSDREEGCLAVPVREGLLIPANSGLPFTHRFDTYAYEGCHMQMIGVRKSGAAALLTWRDPYVAAEVRSVLTNAVWAHGQQVLSPSLVLSKSARSFRVQFLGPGDYVAMAQAYRPAAEAKGFLLTWDEKLKAVPERARLFGAINFKLWSLLDRRMDEASSREEHVSLNWTFDEAAQVAEHLKHDLQLDKVLFTVGGWIHRGYDNQHPDILPTAPECGGDKAFADCARRVRDLGYVFCLHDNYQDIYRDSPSWNEDWVMKTPEGKLARGGHWAGGLAYLTCSKKAVELAQRPQNLPAVKALGEADAYFIDTTYAAGLQECFDPKHPLTRWDDLHWKQAISDYARSVFGIFGSECGREWAVPHSDFFEGLTGVSGQAYHDTGLLKKVGGVVVPLFEIVYRDCIAMYGKYGYDPSQATEYVLEHIALGRPLNYHDVPAHLYWKETGREKLAGDAAESALFMRGRGGWTDGLHPFDRFVKNTAEVLSPLHELTARLPMTAHQFLTADRKVQRTVFGHGSNEVQVIVNASTSVFRAAGPRYPCEALLPPGGFLIAAPEFIAFHATEFGVLRYSQPTLFTLRSQDGKPLAEASRVRAFHGFGDARILWQDTTYTVNREAVLVDSSRSAAGR